MFLKSHMINKRELIYILIVIFGLCYNFQSTAIRLAIISLWMAMPLILLMYNQDNKIGKKALKHYGLLILTTLFLFIPILYNLGSFELELSGPTVEKLSPFIGIFTLPYFYLVSKSPRTINQKIIEYSVWTIIIFFFFEAIYRYIADPGLFLNYSNRHPAKTLGLLATTNVNGQSLSVLFSCLLVINMKHKHIILFTIFLLLISAMARSAIIAVIISTILYILSNTKNIFIRYSSITTISISLYLIIDSLNLLQDGSFLSKIEFINSTILLIENASINQLIFGFGQNYELITKTLGVQAGLGAQAWSPHIPILKGLLYFGFIGIFYYVTHIYLIYKLNKKIYFPLITFLILSFSGAPLFWPGLFSMSLITLNSSK